MPDLPSDVETFIAEHFDCLERLEILLLLRSHCRRDFGAHEVTAELRLGPASAAEHLPALLARGFLSARGDPPRYRYGPDTPVKERLINGLARSYAELRVTVIQRIFAPRRRRVASSND
jgi:hypothetical protein